MKGVRKKKMTKKMISTFSELVDLHCKCSTCLSTEESIRVWNTLCFLFFHERCGVYVGIEKGQVFFFEPFFNSEYRNNWREPLDPTRLDDFPGAPGTSHIDPSQWWANGRIICSIPQKGGWGESMLSHYKWLFECLASKQGGGYRLHFFLNKRDFPMIRADGREKFADFFSEQDPSPHLVSNHIWVANSIADAEGGFSLAPILSPYTCGEFHDQVVPTTEDIENMLALERELQRRNGNVSAITTQRLLLVPPKDMPIREYPRYIDFGKRKNTLIFRGSATGFGTNVNDNPRLSLIQRAPFLQRELDKRGVPIKIDVALSSVNKRVRYIQGAFRKINPGEINRGRFVTMDEQATCKFALYVDGNVGASRLGTLLSRGFVVIALRSNLPQPYFYRLLKHRKNAIIINRIDDLVEELSFCYANPEVAETISNGARHLWKSFSCLSGLCKVLNHSLGRGDNIVLRSPTTPVTSNVQEHYDRMLLGRGGDKKRRNQQRGCIDSVRRINNMEKRQALENAFSLTSTKSGLCVVDMACGLGGDLLKFAHSNVRHYTGVDNSPQRLRVAFQRAKEMNLTKRFGMATNFLNSSMFSSDFDSMYCAKVHADVVSIFNAIHYSWGCVEDTNNMFRNVCNALGSGGILVFTHICPDVLLDLIRRQGVLTTTGDFVVTNDLQQICFYRESLTKVNGELEWSEGNHGKRYRYSLKSAIDNCDEFVVLGIKDFAVKWGFDIMKEISFEHIAGEEGEVTNLWKTQIWKKK